MMTTMTMRKFINGRYAGTNLEIMSSKAATKLPDGTPIRELQLQGMNTTQLAHAAGDLDVHARQTYHDQDRNGDWYIFEGPTIAQQWKAEYQAMRNQRGWTARYYNTGVDPYYEDHQEALDREALGE